MDTTQALMVAVGVLAAVVTGLYASHMASVKRLEGKLDECEADRRELWRHMSALESSQCRDENCPIKKLAKNEPPKDILPYGQRK